MVKRKEKAPGDNRKVETMINASQISTDRRTSSNHGDQIHSLYLESLQLVERLHRRLLDVIKDEFDRNGRSDINAIQALLLFNIGNAELTAGGLRSPRPHPRSHPSPKLKKIPRLPLPNPQPPPGGPPPRPGRPTPPGTA